MQVAWYAKTGSQTNVTARPPKTGKIVTRPIPERQTVAVHVTRANYRNGQQGYPPTYSRHSKCTHIWPSWNSQIRKHPRSRLHRRGAITARYVYNETKNLPKVFNGPTYLVSPSFSGDTTVEHILSAHIFDSTRSNPLKFLRFARSFSENLLNLSTWHFPRSKVELDWYRAALVASAFRNGARAPIDGYFCTLASPLCLGRMS